MKRLSIVGALAVMAGTVGFLSDRKPIYAASNSPQASGASGGQTPAGEGASPVGAKSYASHCAVCHGAQREGMRPVFPSLVGVTRRLTEQQIVATVHNGKGKMPPFPTLESEELTALVHFLGAGELAGAKEATSSASDAKTVHAGVLSGPGNSLYQQNCAFCHGREANGGESGPDLTRSKLVSQDVSGDKISDVVRNGRLEGEKKMPAFKFSNDEMASLVEFVHAQVKKAKAQKGGRKGVDVEDLQTGSVEAGKQYFNGAGTCAKCHSPTGDLAGVATRYQGLQLEERMLYPRDAKSKVAVTLPSGQKVAGMLAYQDEFTVGLRDSAGVYRSWPVGEVKYVVDSPVDRHVELFDQYTDANVHDLMAYLQTLK